MPNEIITKIQFIETCPAPACNLSGQDIEQFIEGRRLKSCLRPAFLVRRAMAMEQTVPEDCWEPTAQDNSSGWLWS